MPPESYAILDDALDAIAPYGIALDNGNFNHAPMVAEALCALGRPEAVMPWIARYRPRMAPRPAAGARIRRDDWRQALGRRERFADWSLFFAEKLQRMPWRKALDLWVGRLAPGFCAAATHGVIRLGHAARALAQGETRQRRRELADALASWAATYQELGAVENVAGGALTPRQAIARVPLVPAERRRPGNITAALAALGGFPEFAPVIGLIDAGGAVAPWLAEQSEVFARICLANARNVPSAIAFIHGVTSHAALGNLLPCLSPATARAALRHAWQTGCGLYACYGSGAATAEEVEPQDEDWGALADRAVAHGDEHVVKFTEACLSRNAAAPSPAYFAAAERILGLIPHR
jgi:hypothetical protein